MLHCAILLRAVAVVALVWPVSWALNHLYHSGDFYWLAIAGLGLAFAAAFWRTGSILLDEPRKLRFGDYGEEYDVPF